MKFKTEPVQRDEYGDYQHSQLPDFDGAECVSKAAIEQWQAEMDFELVINHMDCEITEDHPAWINYFEDGDAGFGEWVPEAPSENAVLLSIHDTEDGPVAWWAIERAKEAA